MAISIAACGWLSTNATPSCNKESICLINSLFFLPQLRHSRNAPHFLQIIVNLILPWLRKTYKMDPNQGWDTPAHRVRYLSSRIERQGLRQRVVSDRIRKMEWMQRHDRQLEEALIFQGPAAILDRAPYYDWWFLSEDMAGVPGYILQFLGAAVKAFLPEGVFLKVDNKYNQDWTTNRFTSHENVGFSFSYF